MSQQQATKKPKLGPITEPDRQAYVSWLGSDAEWGRPTELTAREVWQQLASHLPIALDGLMPRGKKQPTGDEYDRRVLVAKQSLVVALDCAIARAGRLERDGRRSMFTKNALFEAVALRWSTGYREAREAGVRSSYDLKPETLAKAQRELLLAGVRFDTLWRVVTQRWSAAPPAAPPRERKVPKQRDCKHKGRLDFDRARKCPACFSVYIAPAVRAIARQPKVDRAPSLATCNPLFVAKRISDKGRLRGYNIDVVPSDLLTTFESLVEADSQYRRPRQPRPLLLASRKPKPEPPRPVRQEFCEEQPYNVVNLGEESERVLSILENARLRFNADVFRDDYEALRSYLGAGTEYWRGPATKAQGRNYRKLLAFVKGWRRLYRQTETLRSRRPLIRSRFFRATNRRYHASNFWPETAPKDFRERWFTTKDGGRFIERDIATSQIQVLAVLLEIEELEQLASSENPTLKEWLAQHMWARHMATPGGILAPGYDEPDAKGRLDPRLVAFAKKHLMRFYGADLSKLVRYCGKNVDLYGPGWRTSRGLSAKPEIKSGTKTVALTKSGVAEAVDQATAFFVSLPAWTNGLEEFLEACKTLAKKKQTTGGVVFRDPLCQSEVRWDHAQRGTDTIGHERIEVRPWGRHPKKGAFQALPAGSIDPAALRNFVAPCLTHMCDAFFASLVLKNLDAAGVTDVIGLHDAWRVPETLPAVNGAGVRDGSAVLKQAIEDAGQPWLVGLRGIYDQFVADLGDDPTFGLLVTDMWKTWRKRVETRDDWPKFLSR